MNTHRLKRPLSALSAATLLAALVAAPVPVRAEPSLGSGGSTAAQGTNADSAQTPSPDRTDSPAEADAGSEAITDPVLQVGADSTARNLSWMSESSGGGEVRWAPASEVDGGKLPADADRAETTDSGLATDLKRHFNHASMTDLEPDTEYAYQVGSHEDGFTEVQQFTTGSSGGDDEFLVFGDPQVGAGGGDPDDAAGWDRTLSSAVATADDPSFFYSLGDQVNSAGNQEQYAQYLAPEATRTIPQATTIGNHDVSSKAYEQHFNRPNVSQDHGGGGVITSGGDYWFIEDGVLFLNINSNSPDMDAHAEFIDEVVAEHGDHARWTVLGFHHSIYSTATHWSDLDVKRLRKAIPPVAARNDIDLVVSGHDHIYNRTFLMDGEGKPVEGSEAGAEEEKEDGQTLYLTLTSSSGSKFYDYVPGLDWEGKSVHNDVPAFTRVLVSDEALRATTYEVPAGGAPADGERAEAQAASEQIDDVELRHAEAEEPAPDDDAEADAGSGAGAAADGSDAESDAGAGAGAEADGPDAGSEAGAGVEADGAGEDADAGAAGAGADGSESDSDGSDDGAVSADTDGGTNATGSNADAHAAGANDDGNGTDSGTADAGTADSGAEASGTEANAAGTGDDSDSSGTASAGGGGDLPRTGDGLALPLAVGAGALALGATLLVASRRRRGAGLS
ncbi:FN3 domain-containing metallophosphoesterase family protein [Brevibacterium sp. JSBI002]|uniref:FN3 domain-containing metallophosphoesterase family protein n=1 Tax=Brevibacterium sp. JSBI002 TaxID=2886045 RepID=UPI00222E59AC|nr:FN3 domain-containing metallophosphoesterase family protein [Brevibacterium sp. JSBI002]UZD63080.1 fibronectin type III domain-containing protein [Brevibacterium sp. JSBI002]